MSKVEDKLKQALIFKDEGNEFYKAKDYKKALRKYHNAVLYMKGIDNDLHGMPAFLQSESVDPNSDKRISDELEEDCIKANVSIYNNLAACLLANARDKTPKVMDDYEKVVKYADIVLELEQDNDKALYRKAQALKQLRNFSDAKDTFEFLKAVQGRKGVAVPKDVLESIKECQEALKDSAKKEKSMYQNMFN